MTTRIPTSDPRFPTHLVGLAEGVCARFYELFPDSDERYGGRGRDFCVHDNAYLAAWLLEAIRLESPMTLARDVGWLADLLEARGFPMDRFVHNLALVGDAAVEGGLASRVAVDATLGPVAAAISDRMAT